MIAALELLPNNSFHGRVGSPGIPIATFAATPVDLLSGYCYFSGPEATLSGIVCGQCSDCFRTEDGKRLIVRHASVEHVRACYDTSARIEAESAGEIAAERAVERYFEEGPHGGYYAGSEEEARDRWLDSLRGE